MKHPDLVLIDTCIWVQFFNRPHSLENRVVDELLDTDRAALIGLILGELLSGFRRDAEADWAAALFRGLHWFEPTWNDWRFAARLNRELASRSHRLPLTDLAVAATAIGLDCAVYTTDPHFDLIPSLKRFHPP